MNSHSFPRCQLLALVVGWLLATAAVGAPVVTPWTPIFKGIDLIGGTNRTSGGDFSNLQVARAFRVDLTDPDIKLLPTPRIANYQNGSRETAAMTVSRFLQANKVQIAVNGGFFDPSDYYQPEGTPCYLSGLFISRGDVVSTMNGPSYAASVMFDAANHGRVIYTNWPPASTTDVYNALTGDYPVLIQGVNIGRKYLGRGGVHDTNPRTAIGLSQDGLKLFLLTIDGRQPGYSNGALDYETAAWLLLLGAYDGVNFDGGGSTTMVMEDSTGKPKRLNRPSAVADSGRERVVGSHFGVFAQPLAGFINQLAVQPDDDAATVTWTTTAQATTQVEFGLTEALGSASELLSAPVTNHATRLTGLQPGMGYYYRALSVVGPTTHQSPVQYFTTTNPVTTNQVLQLTSGWKYTFANLDDTDWTAPGFDDGAWSGPGPGLMWINTRHNDNGVGPLGTEMPIDPITSWPYYTYYFRTHFQLAAKGSGVSIRFAGFLDDGGVFYLNGHEIYRLRMDPAPAVISNSTLAPAYPCSGDANCLDEFVVTGPEADFLAAGDNVLAVEVHNYNPRSSDITLGFDVFVNERLVSAPALQLKEVNGERALTWDRGGFVLEQAPNADGPWTETPGPVVSSPYLLGDPARSSMFYRLKK